MQGGCIMSAPAMHQQPDTNKLDALVTIPTHAPSPPIRVQNISVISDNDSLFLENNPATILTASLKTNALLTINENFTCQ